MKSNMWEDINQAYTAKLIMTPLSSLLCWEIGNNPDEYLDLDGALKYDVVPVKEKGKIIGFMTKEEPFKSQTIEKGWIVTQDTPISDLVNLFAEHNKPAFFVFYRDELAGILTPADLNKLPARTYIYSLIGDVELMLGGLIRTDSRLSHDDILGAVLPEHARAINNTLNELQKQNVDVDITQLLYLSDMLSIVQTASALCKRLGFMSRTEAENGLKGINNLRNRTMHLVKPLLSKMPDDLISLRESLARIQSILISG